MLRTLHIRNLAIIDALELEFGDGFSVLTGETGAGKSILIDALGLIIGERAESTLVRAGAERAEVAAEFDLGDAAGARAWLAARELGDGDTCLIRRSLSADGRTRAFVNGTPLNAGELRGLGEHLVEIFGQGESQQLLRADAQRAALDDFGVAPQALEAVAAGAAEFQRIEAEIARLQAAQSRDPAQLDYLRFQLQELDALSLQDGELDQLDGEQRRLANAGRLIEEGGAAQVALYGGDGSAYDQLGSVLGLLRGLLPLHAGFGDAENLVATAQMQLRDAADAVRGELDHLELDPERLTTVERRLGAIHDLARKHRVRAEELMQRHAELRSELGGLEHAAEQLSVLAAARTAAVAAYRNSAAALTQSRQTQSDQLAAAVTARVRALGMPNARFVVAVEPAGSSTPNAHGEDLVRFDFSANPGQPPRALAKVASGGELSRVSLALQVSLHGAGLKAGDAAATMIFDEVDAGIGGAVAEIVGQQLRALGDRRQVLCVTHLAQVAAQGRHHFSIAKEVVAAETYTRVSPLDAGRRVTELARMLGGQHLSAATQALAKDLLQRAKTG
ncbi:MAG: repair protein RecN [Nevskia sp.]|nr:repair protein RecN [Nevskia sp.]